MRRSPGQNSRPKSLVLAEIPGPELLANFKYRL